MRTRRTYVLLAVLTLSSVNSIFRASAQQRQDETPIRIRTNEVALDIVVRDKKLRPVRDLTAGEFEVYEDGVRQQIGSFRFVLRDPQAPGVTTSVDTVNGKEVPVPKVATPRDNASPGVRW